MSKPKNLVETPPPIRWSKLCISALFQISRQIYTHSNHPLQPPRHTHYRTRKIPKIYWILLLTTPANSYLSIIIESSQSQFDPWSHFVLTLVLYVSSVYFNMCDHACEYFKTTYGRHIDFLVYPHQRLYWEPSCKLEWKFPGFTGISAYCGFSEFHIFRKPRGGKIQNCVLVGDRHMVCFLGGWTSKP
jgi:hypothetical protein